MNDKNEKDPFEDMQDKAVAAFSKVSEDLGTIWKETKEDVVSMIKQAPGDIRDGINYGRKVAGDAYQYIEDTAGKDRLAGAALGAKIGGLWGVRAGVMGVSVGGVVGGVIGFAAGRKLYNWLEAGKSNDNTPPADAPQPPASKPQDPAP